MNPRLLLNFLRSPTGALVLFLIGLVIVLILVNSRRPFDSSIPKGRTATLTTLQRNYRKPFVVRWCRSTHRARRRSRM